MTSTPDVARIVAGLSEAQKAYLLAFDDANSAYMPRHGRTANWAIRRGYALAAWKRAEDGKVVPWLFLASEGGEFAGCILSETGLAVRQHIIDNDLPPRG